MFGASLATVPPGVDGAARLAAVRERVLGADGPSEGSAEDRRPYLRSDHMLVRFLIARQWDVERSVAMLRDHYRWLEERQMESLWQVPFPEEIHIKKYYPQSYHGTDKLGRPLYIERPGRIDMPRLCQFVKPERLVDYFAVESEKQVRRRLPACSLLRGEVVDKSLNIIDLAGLNLSLLSHTTARKVVQEIMKIQQTQYPEMMGKLIIINAPWAFKAAWSTLKSMLDEKTVSKISIHGTNKDAFSKALLELVDADQLPSLYGGSCICDGKDPESCMLHVKGPWVDPDICKILESQPLEQIMTPDGAKLFHSRSEDLASAPAAPVAVQQANAAAGAGAADAGSSAAAAGAGAAGAASVPADAGADAAAAAIAEAGVTAAMPIFHGDDLPASSPASPALAPEAPAGVVAGELASQEADGSSAEEEALDEAPAQLKGVPPALNLELEQLLQSIRELEAASIRTVDQWVEERGVLLRKIGRYTIERAQGYYDCLAICTQTTQEYARQQEEVREVLKLFEGAVRNLRRAETAFEAFLTGEQGDLSDAEWLELAGHLPEHPDIHEMQDNPKLKRAYWLSRLSDRVASLQRQRDAAVAQADSKEEELRQARQVFETEQLRHRSCGANCSVKRAAPYFEQCKVKDMEIEQDRIKLQVLDQRLNEARRRVVDLQVGERTPSGPSEAMHSTLSAKYSSRKIGNFDELSLQSFEMRGGARQDDDARSEGWQSCFSDDD